MKKRGVRKLGIPPEIQTALLETGEYELSDIGILKLHYPAPRNPVSPASKKGKKNNSPKLSFKLIKSNCRATAYKEFVGECEKQPWAQKLKDKSQC